MVTAHNHGLDPPPYRPSNIKSANAQGTMKLVGREASEVHVRHRDRQPSGALRQIRVKQRPDRLRHAPNLISGLEDAHLVIGRRHTDQPCILGQQTLKCRQIDLATVFERRADNFAAFHGLGRRQHGKVFTRPDDDAGAAPDPQVRREPHQGEVVGLGRS